MKKQYIITRDKFMGLDEVRHLLTTCEEMSQLDLLLGRQTWVTRSMVVSVLLRTGLRRSEAAALKVGDLHLTGKENYLTVQHGKGNKRRDVYFNSALAKQLKEYLNIKSKSWGQPVQQDDYLFTHGRDNKRYTSTALFFSFREALKKAGLPVSGWEGERGHKVPPWRGGKVRSGYYPHSCRHSFATHSLAVTNNLRHVQKQLGHSSITMTALYSDVSGEQRQQLADKLSI